MPKRKLEAADDVAGDGQQAGKQAAAHYVRSHFNLSKACLEPSDHADTRASHLP